MACDAVPNREPVKPPEVAKEPLKNAFEPVMFLRIKSLNSVSLEPLSICNEPELIRLNLTSVKLSLFCELKRIPAAVPKLKNVPADNVLLAIT